MSQDHFNVIDTKDNAQRLVNNVHYMRYINVCHDRGGISVRLVNNVVKQEVGLWELEPTSVS